MSEYIQRGERTRNRNHLMIERVPVYIFEETWAYRISKGLAFVSVMVLAGLVLAMGIMSMQ